MVWIQWCFFRGFVGELISGDAAAANVALRQFDKFSTSPAPGKIRWPLCYVERILYSVQTLWSSPSVVPEALHGIRSSINELKQDARRTETGLDWEAIVAIGLTLSCLGVQYGLHQGRAASVIPNFVEAFVGNRNVEHVLVRPMPQDVNDIILCRDWVSQQFEQLAGGRKPTLGLFIPQYAKFPIFDSFLAYSSPEDSVELVGIQMKLGRAYPDHDVPEGVQAGVLIRGCAPGRVNGTTRRGWTYLDRASILRLLGYSLEPLYPSSWPK